MIDKYFSNPKPIFGRILPDVTWSTNNNKVLLTFDDSPCFSVTESILKKLDDNKVTALFFVNGKNVNQYSDLAKEILSAGHTLGNHTQHHHNMLFAGYHKYLSEIEKCNITIEDKLGIELKYFRPPFGKVTLNSLKAAKVNNLRSIMWTMMSFDYKNDLKIVKFVVSKNLKNDTIAVFHDNLKVKDIILDSLDYFFETIAEKNLEIGTPDECLN